MRWKQSANRSTWSVLLAVLAVLGAVTLPAGATPAPGAITSPPPPSGIVGAHYEHVFEATPAGGRWAVSDGSLPPGLHLGEDGVLSGTPESTGTFPLEVTVAWPGLVGLAAGGNHSCALLGDASASCWGEPVAGASAPGPFTELTAGAYHTCGLTPAGAVDCWGQNTWGQAVDHPGPYTTVAAGGARTCALTPAGDLDCWGYEADVSGGPYTSVAVGSTHLCGLTPAGAAECTSGDVAGPFTALAAGYGHACGLTPDGAATCWGLDNAGQAADRPGPFTAITAGLYFSCGLTATGQIECWGDDGYGQLSEVPAGTFSLIDAGSWHACASPPAGPVTCWGNSDVGHPAPAAGPPPVSQALVITVTTTCDVEGWPFADVGPDHRFCSEIAWMWREGVAEGWPDGTFRPTAAVTRQAVAAFLHRLAGSPPVEIPSEPTFSDVDPDQPFAEAIEWMAAAGLTDGYVDGGFHPSATMSRQAFAAFLHRLAGSPAVVLPATPTFLDVGVDHPFRGPIEWMAATGLSTGYADDRYHPTDPVSRQAFAAFLQRFDGLP